MKHQKTITFVILLLAFISTSHLIQSAKEKLNSHLNYPNMVIVIPDEPITNPLSTVEKEKPCNAVNVNIARINHSSFSNSVW